MNMSPKKDYIKNPLETKNKNPTLLECEAPKKTTKLQHTFFRSKKNHSTDICSKINNANPILHGES